MAFRVLLAAWTDCYRKAVCIVAFLARMVQEAVPACAMFDVVLQYTQK
jgi:hypothetical protein